VAEATGHHPSRGHTHRTEKTLFGAVTFVRLSAKMGVDKACPSAAARQLICPNLSQLAIDIAAVPNVMNDDLPGFFIYAVYDTIISNA